MFILLWLLQFRASHVAVVPRQRVLNVHCSNVISANRRAGPSAADRVPRTRPDLLKNSEIQVFKIIDIVNFSGTYVFYRRFEQEYGMIPDQYRKRNKN